MENAVPAELLTAKDLHARQVAVVVPAPAKGKRPRGLKQTREYYSRLMTISQISLKWIFRMSLILTRATILKKLAELLMHQTQQALLNVLSTDTCKID
jgi:hypothetical protein